jgi:prephenate dehydrogenase
LPLKEKLFDLNITIAGLGLMGGSMALALKRKGFEVSGIDTDSSVLQQAISGGAITTGTSEFNEGLAYSDVLILAMPVGEILRVLANLRTMEFQRCFLIDLGSTKKEIQSAMEQLPESFEAIGGHPMCGREQSGFAAADPDLYKGESFVLCRNQRSTEWAIDVALQLSEAVGAKPLFTGAEIHDKIVASTSHLPYLMSTVLITLVNEAAQEEDLFWQISSTGLRDTSRLAGSNPKMMLDILLSNKDEILNNVRLVRSNLDQLITELESGNKNALRDRLQSAKDKYDEYMRRRWR